MAFAVAFVADAFVFKYEDEIFYLTNEGKW